MNAIRTVLTTTVLFAGAIEMLCPRGPALLLRSEAAHAGEVWFASGSVKVKLHDPAQSTNAVWDGTKISIAAARNEYVCFQAVVTPGAAGQGSVTVDPFVGPGGTLDAGGTCLYRVVYPTAANTDWPDPMVPVAQGAAINVAAGSNNPVMIELYVPAGTAPGIYNSNITVNAPGSSPKIPIALTVWNITLPEIPTVSTYFSANAGDLASYYGYTSGSVPHQNLLRKFYAQYKKFRISPGGLDLGTVTRNNMTVNNNIVSVDFSATDPWMSFYLDTLKFQHFYFPLDAYTPRRLDMTVGSGHPDGIYYWGAVPYDMSATYTDHVGQYIKIVADHYRAKGWLDKAIVYATDEPIAFNNDAGNGWYWNHPNYHVVQQYYNLVKSKAPDLKFINTVEVVPDLQNYCDIWAVPGGTYHELTAQAEAAAGRTTWWYNTDAGIAAEGFKGRALYWDTFARGVSGCLLWGTTWWGYGTVNSDPWQGSNSNGDGYIFYPGSSAGIVDDVVPSQRAFLTRAGLQDYELLHLYAQRYGIDAARAVAESVAVGSSFASGGRYHAISDDLFYQVRDYLAAQITRADGCMSWRDSLKDSSNVLSSIGLAQDAAWEGNFSLANACAPVTVDAMDAVGGWHSNDQVSMSSSVTVDTAVKTQGAGSLRIDWWRNNDLLELGGYTYMHNGRVVTGAIALPDWSQYQFLEMDVRSVDHSPGSLNMLIGGAGGTIVGNNIHAFSRYQGGPGTGWTHAVMDISQAPRSQVQYFEPIAYNYMMENPLQHYSWWIDNIAVRKAGYLASGTLVSQTIDLGSGVSQWNGLEYVSQWQLTAGAGLAFETRTSADGSTWNPWANAAPNGQFSLAIASPPARHFQYRVSFTSTGAATPMLSEVRVNWRPTGVYGDADGDGAFRLADLNVLVDWLLMRTAPPAAGSQTFTLCDVNGDCKLDLADLNLYVDKLLVRITKFSVEP
jgi:hypothetical protein